MADLYIPADIQDRASSMKTQVIGFAAGVCESLDNMLEAVEGREGQDRFERPWVTDEDPRLMVDAMRLASLDMWVFFNCVLEGEQDDASLMKAFIEQKGEVLRKQ